jgi:hypothetical protein
VEIGAYKANEATAMNANDKFFGGQVAVVTGASTGI